MAAQTPQPPNPSLFDEWIAEVGEAGVVAAIEDTRRRAANGSLPGFCDTDALADHWNTHHAAQA